MNTGFIGWSVNLETKDKNQMPRPSNTEARRAQIVGGMLRVVAERGYERATVKDIADAAGLSPGLLHYHFASKQEILVALAETLAEAAHKRQSELAAPRTARARLLALLDAHVARGKGADPAAVACWVALGAEAPRIPELMAVYRRVTEAALKTLRDQTRAALVEEKRSPKRATSIAAGLLAAVEGAFKLATAAPGLLPEGFASPTLRAMAEGLLDAQPLARPVTKNAKKKPTKTTTKPSKRRAPKRKNKNSRTASRRS